MITKKYFIVLTKKINCAIMISVRRKALGGMTMEEYIKYSESDCNDKELEITMVYVPQDERSQGIGRKLVESAIEYARQNNYATVGLYAYQQDKDGPTTEELISWYESLGFESDGDDDSLMTYYL